MTTQLDNYTPSVPGWAAAFRVALLEAGSLMPPSVITDAWLCFATSQDDIDETVAAATWALKRVV